jgi:hypothetical protein
LYSVLRFTIDRPRAGELLALGEAMNAVEPGIYEGPRRAGDGFACDIETSPLWADHVEGVRDFVKAHAASIRDAIARGARVTFDVAIAPEDQAAVRHALILVMPPAFLAELGSAGVGVEVTTYKPDLAPPPGEPER